VKIIVVFRVTFGTYLNGVLSLTSLHYLCSTKVAVKHQSSWVTFIIITHLSNTICELTVSLKGQSTLRKYFLNM